jgi:hypothetical protein
MTRRTTAKEQREVVAALRLLLERVAAGELTAPRSMIRRIEGAIIVLEALVKPTC